MSVNRPVPCLLCDKKVVVNELTDHIHKHFNYFPHKCNSCSFESVDELALEQHGLDYDDHEPLTAKDPYKEWIVKTLRIDILYAAKNSREELMRTKQHNASQPPTPSVPNRPSSSQSMRKKEKQPVPPKSSSEEEEEEEEPAPAPRSAPKKKRRVEEEEEEVPKRARDNKAAAAASKRRERSPISDPVDEYDKDVEELRAKSLRSVKCDKCKQVVNCMLSSRQEHVRKYHMENVERKNKEVYKEMLERETAIAFPGMINKLTQCFACRKDIGSVGGRYSHAAQHIHDKQIACPFNRCIFSTNILSDIHSHLVKAHNVQGGRLGLGTEHAGFHKTFMTFKSKVETVISLLFSVEFEASKGKKKKSAEDDEDVDWVAKSVRAVTQVTPRTPTTATRRRSKSESEEEESEEEEEEKKIPKKKKIKNDDEDEVEVLDDKEDARSVGASSFHSSVSASGAASVKSDVKPPSTSSMKSEGEVKNEPVTPQSRHFSNGEPPRKFPGRSIPLPEVKNDPVTPQSVRVPSNGEPPRKFPGRSIPLPEGDVSHFGFPNAREEANKRRMERNQRGLPYARGGGRGVPYPRGGGGVQYGRGGGRGAVAGGGRGGNQQWGPRGGAHSTPGSSHQKW